jgi:hypothetical protein
MPSPLPNAVPPSRNSQSEDLPAWPGGHGGEGRRGSRALLSAADRTEAEPLPAVRRAAGSPQHPTPHYGVKEKCNCICQLCGWPVNQTCHLTNNNNPRLGSGKTT